jgi:hypothetical protein
MPMLKAVIAFGMRLCRLEKMSCCCWICAAHSSDGAKLVNLDEAEGGIFCTYHSVFCWTTAIIAKPCLSSNDLYAVV